MQAGCQRSGKWYVPCPVPAGIVRVRLPKACSGCPALRIGLPSLLLPSLSLVPMDRGTVVGLRRRSSGQGVRGPSGIGAACRRRYNYSSSGLRLVTAPTSRWGSHWSSKRAHVIHRDVTSHAMRRLQRSCIHSDLPYGSQRPHTPCRGACLRLTGWRVDQKSVPFRGHSPIGAAGHSASALPCGWPHRWLHVHGVRLALAALPTGPAAALPGRCAVCCLLPFLYTASLRQH